MRELQRIEQLLHQRGELAEIEARAAIQMLAQAGALDVLHRDERDVLVFAVLVNADDVRMLEPAGGFRLVLEARHVLGGELRRDVVFAYRLDRDEARDVRVVRLVDDPHRPLAEDAADLVLAETLGVDHRVRFRERRRGGKIKSIAGSGKAEAAQPSSIFIAWTRLAFIRPIASVSTPISSLLAVLNSPAS